jgi:hypothetical protein
LNPFGRTSGRDSKECCRSCWDFKRVLHPTAVIRGKVAWGFNGGAAVGGTTSSSHIFNGKLIIDPIYNFILSLALRPLVFDDEYEREYCNPVIIFSYIAEKAFPNKIIKNK